MLQRILILSPSILGPGIQAILEHQMTWKLQVEPTLDLEAIAEACQAFQPQVTIVDADCIDVLALFESLGLPRVKQVGGIIVVTQASALEEEYLFFLFKWGVAACLTTAITPEELETIVERVYAGEYLLSSALLQPARPCASPRRTPETRSQMRAPAAPWQVDDQARARASPLSPQEVAILAGMAEGKTNKEIARTLAIREKTIKKYITVIFGKLGCDNRTSAIVCALRQQWIRLPVLPKMLTEIDVGKPTSSEEADQTIVPKLLAYTVDHRLTSNRVLLASDLRNANTGVEDV